MNIRTLLQTKLINILNIHTNPDFKFLAECTEWVAQKLVSRPQTGLHELLTNPGSNISSAGLVYDHWAAVSTELRRQLLIPLNNESCNTTTVVRIEEGHKTVITMGGSSSGPTNFRFLEETLDWVTCNLVSSNRMGVVACVCLLSASLNPPAYCMLGNYINPFSQRTILFVE